VLPLQWRIAVSFISGFFVLNVITPIVFAHRGPIEAGRYGIAMTIFSAVSSLGMSWVYAKAPAFTMHISRGERRELNALFKAVALRSIAVTTALSASVVLAAWVLEHLGVASISRLASPPVLACLALVTTVNSVVFAMAIFMRAHREEPLAIASVATGALTTLAVYFGSRADLLTMSMMHVAVIALVMLPWTAWIFRRYIRRAH
jgi:hypothetical protein